METRLVVLGPITTDTTGIAVTIGIGQPRNDKRTESPRKREFHLEGGMGRGRVEERRRRGDWERRGLLLAQPGVGERYCESSIPWGVTSSTVRPSGRGCPDRTIDPLTSADWELSLP